MFFKYKHKVTMPTCNCKASPRSLFITWLAIQGRLSTSNRLANWGIQCQTVCYLCKTETESADNLFFKCEYVAAIWIRILKLVRLQGYARGMCAWLPKVQAAARKSSPSNKLLVMFFAESVYSLWLERNKRVFRQACNSDFQVYKEICFRVASRCLRIRESCY